MIRGKDPRSTARWRRVARQAFERDMRANAPCHICHDPIDYAAKPGTPYAYEPDHYPLTVAAMVKMGKPELAYDLGAVKPSHCMCNRSDGASKANTYDIGRPTRLV